MPSPLEFDYGSFHFDPLAYGRCLCGGMYDPRWVDISFQNNPQPVIIKMVPQGVCRLCGSRVFKAGILERIEDLYRVSEVKNAG